MYVITNTQWQSQSIISVCVPVEQNDERWQSGGFQKSHSKARPADMDHQRESIPKQTPWKPPLCQCWHLWCSRSALTRVWHQILFMCEILKYLPCVWLNLRTWRWFLFLPRALATSLKETVMLFYMWVQCFGHSQTQQQQLLLRRVTHSLNVKYLSLRVYVFFYLDDRE